ncbi:MAG: hypothetical protein JNM88_00590 [Chitinophagaceae bacterium]|nr:hypothetical protein [Chitinophagaceae bacterium]
MATAKKTIKAASQKLGMATKKKVRRGLGLADVNENIPKPKKELDMLQASKGLKRKKPALKKSASGVLSLANAKGNDVEPTDLSE